MKKLLFYFLCALLCFVSSCTKEELTPYKQQAVKVLKTPNVIAYSGDKYFGVTRANAGDGDLNNQVWKDFNANDLSNITDVERQAVLDAIAKKVTGDRISEDVVFPWENYFLQDVISGQNGSWYGAGSHGTSSSSYSFEAFNKGAQCNSPWWAHCSLEESANYEEVTNSAHLNNYFQKVNEDGSQERINETTLMTNMKYGTYEEMKGKQFRWYVNCHENAHWYEYIVVEVDGNYYICFDFGCGHPENDVDGNPGRGAEHNDWDYNDWILKITPAGPHEDVWRGDNTATEEPQLPPVVKDKKSEVEVNLKADQKPGDYLESHLSIHVRYATDVELFIPVPREYYCEADDMAILNKHTEDLTIHGGPYKTEYVINGFVVSLNIEYVEDGIRIWTEGICEEVIEYCEEHYGDGLTFEVWNYFNEHISIEQLKEYLNQATIKFLDDCPDYYINADVEEDCTVSIVDEQRDEFNTQETGPWKNNSDMNQIYEKK